MFSELQSKGGGGGSGYISPETKQFSISYGTPVDIVFDNPHTEFIAVNVSSSTQTISEYIISDGVKALNSNLKNWRSNYPASDSGGYAWSSDNKTLTLTMPRNFYSGTYNIMAM